MTKFRLVIILLSALLPFYSCGVNKSARSVAPATTIGEVPGGYIDRYKDLAISEMQRSGVPASITLAQGILESNFGRSRLAVVANNHFGIKCHSGWRGATITHDDDSRNECFRRYNSAEESFRDHSDFLTSTPRYRDLFKLKTDDYKGWARGLKQAGYATDPNYANLLIKRIEDYELWRYDTGYRGSARTLVATNEPINTTSVFASEPNVRTETSEFEVPAKVSRVNENNRIRYIIVNEKDTRESIEQEFKLLKWELIKYNELGDNFNFQQGQILYLQPKRNKAELGKNSHNATSSDTMYSISQQYGIKLKKLYEMNRMREDEEPREGDRIWLRGKKPVGS